MLGRRYSEIRTRYGRLLAAIALLLGTAAISVGLEPRGSSAAGTDETSPQARSVAQEPQKNRSRHAVLRFGEVYVAYALHPAPGGPCWSVHSLSGEVLAIFADERALKTLFPEVDTTALHDTAVHAEWLAN